MNLEPAEITNAWRHFWASQMRSVGGETRLPLEPLGGNLLEILARAPEPQPQPDVDPEPALNRKARRTLAKQRRAKKKNGPVIGPQAAWAKSLQASELNRRVTLRDVLDGIDVYFSLFKKLRRIDPDAYTYFSKVGVPLVTGGHMVWKKDIEQTTVSNILELPTYMGAFFSRTTEEYRKEIQNDEPSMLDFHYFQKHGEGFKFTASAPLDTTIYGAHWISLDRRNSFTKAELKKYPCVRKSWGVWFPIGILPDGTTRALATPMTRVQTLPDGGTVHHSGTMIPPGLYQLSKSKDPHRLAIEEFNIIRYFCASALSGVEVILKRDGICVRLGLPITYLREFFGDRDPTSGRRGQIYHFVGEHYRSMADGREIRVGEHLRGLRHFTWRGCEVSIAVPGIHHASPEGFSAPGYEIGEDEPVPEGMVGVREFTAEIEAHLFRRRRVTIRRGQPSEKYLRDHLTEDRAEEW